MNNLQAVKTQAKDMLSHGILNPSNLQEAMEMANVMSQSTIIPKDFGGNPGNILVAMQWGMELGMAPLQAMQNIAVINGRPSLWGDALIAIVRGSDVCEYVKEEVREQGGQMVAVCRSKRKNEDEHVTEFSMEDAQTAGLWGKQGPWKQYPKRMLQLRARAFNLRDNFADVLKGMNSAEEQTDIVQAEKDVTPAPAQPAEEPKALPHYPQEQFNKNIDAWLKSIADGKNTPERIITMVESKGSLTTEMKSKIRGE